MNKVSFIGNVGNTPTVTTLESGTIVMNFDLATSEKYIDKKTGQEVQKTEWHRIVAWNDTATKVANALKKGSFITIQAKAINRVYDKTIDIKVSPRKTIQHTEKVRVTEYRAYDILISQ